MHKTTIFCDCCGREMKEPSGAELTGQLRAQGMRWHTTGEMDLHQDVTPDAATAPKGRASR